MIMRNMNFLRKNVKKVIAALMSAVTLIPAQPVRAYNPENNDIVNKRTTNARRKSNGDSESNGAYTTSTG